MRALWVSEHPLWRTRYFDFLGGVPKLNGVHALWEREDPLLQTRYLFSLFVLVRKLLEGKFTPRQGQNVVPFKEYTNPTAA